MRNKEREKEKKARLSSRTSGPHRKAAIEKSCKEKESNRQQLRNRARWGEAPIEKSCWGKGSNIMRRIEKEKEKKKLVK